VSEAAERERLVAALRLRGVDYLAPSDAAGALLDDEALIAALAEQADPRLRQALIALFILHPELAPLVPSLCARLAPPAVVELTAHYQAAVYLQCMWRIRLNHYLPPTPDLPDYFSASLGLPDPLDEYGKAGLYALADWHSAREPWRANHLSEYEGVAELLLAALGMKGRQAMWPLFTSRLFCAIWPRVAVGRRVYIC
jgi:hypothetical protein